MNQGRTAYTSFPPTASVIQVRPVFSEIKAAHSRYQAEPCRQEIPVVKIREDRCPGADPWAALRFETYITCSYHGWGARELLTHFCDLELEGRMI